MIAVCASELQNFSRSAEEFISSAARLGRCISDAALMESSSSLRNLSRSVSDLLTASLWIHQNYLGLFSPSEGSNPITQYRERYSDGHTEESEISEKNWISYFETTGFFFDVDE